LVVVINFGSVDILTGQPVVGSVYLNASKRRVVSIDGNSKNQVAISELYNSVEITDHNYADYNNEYNRVA
jgi:hypothetical protein